MPGLTGGDASRSERPVYALSFHADYRCGRSGVCCTADWDVPVDLPLFRSLDDAVRTGRLGTAADPANGRAALLQGPDLPDDAAAMVARTSRGDCVFYHRGSGLCVIHRDMGHDRLPATCRHFPRLALRDRRGTFITLTHYCPTAAASLFRPGPPIGIVEGPAAFPPAEYGGLTITPDDWPPLLHPHVLMDHPGYMAWERHMVAVCATDGASPESVIATLARDARLVRRHRPDRGPIADAVASLPREAVTASAPADLGGSLALFVEAIGAVPDDMRPEPDEEQLADAYVEWVRRAWVEWPGPLNRYVAAKAFASWTAYQGRGVLSVVRGLEAALAIVRVEAARQCRHAGRPLDEHLLREAIREADFVLNHLAAGDVLAEAWSAVEREDSGPRSKTATTGP